MNIVTVTNKETGETSPAEVRLLESGMIKTAHREFHTGTLVLQEFTEYSNGVWDNDKFTCEFDSIEDTNASEKIVRISKK
jgi:hypothetical protein